MIPFHQQQTFSKGVFEALQNEVFDKIGNSSNVSDKFFETEPALPGHWVTGLAFLLTFKPVTCARIISVEGVGIYEQSCLGRWLVDPAYAEDLIFRQSFYFC